MNEGRRGASEFLRTGRGWREELIQKAGTDRQAGCYGVNASVRRSRLGKGRQKATGRMLRGEEEKEEEGGIWREKGISEGTRADSALHKHTNEN